MPAPVKGYVSGLVLPVSIREALCLAKTHIDPVTRKRYRGFNVFLHCRISGLVAMGLVGRMGHTLGMYGCTSLAQVGALVALHDVGKVSPGFQNKILSSVGSVVPGMSPYVKGVSGVYCDNHAETSQQALFDQGLRVPGIVAGKHHGSSPVGVLGPGSSTTYGGALWQEQRDKLTVRLLKSFGLVVQDLPTVMSTDQERMLSGLTCVADWVASGEGFTP